MKKADGVIIAVILAVCAALLLFSRHGERQAAGRLRAEIYTAGRLTQTVVLAEEAPHELALAGGKIILSVERDGVAVSRADCPAQTCVHTGKITLPGQLISCLPNRVIVKLIGDGGPGQEVDIIAK
ncbi:MAG: NusG domain II-containing protein [Oscillospiraceae bacterium]|jgi:hypothetical protein|nr:NusG domain II-containing protein [Oscillospiraceae bacterium]